MEFVGNPFGGGLFQLGLLSYPVTALWIVGFANVFNLIDGLDGLAAGVAAIAAASFLLLAIDMNQFVAAVLAAALIGACVGFLRYNFNPASIIMGDSGALFIGFALGCMSLLGVMKSAAAITLVAPLLVIGVPVFDTASAIIRRWRSGRPIQEADNGHIHHRLLHRGFSQRQTVLTIYAWSAALGDRRLPDGPRGDQRTRRHLPRPRGPFGRSWRHGSGCSSRRASTATTRSSAGRISRPAIRSLSGRPMM